MKARAGHWCVGFVFWSVCGGAAFAQPGITRSLEFFPDGRTIVSASTAAIDIWDVATGKLLKRLEGHTDFVNGLAVSRDGRTIVSGSYDGTARVWNAKTGESTWTFKGGGKAIATVAISPDGKTAAAAGYDQTIWLWDTARGKEIRRIAGFKADVLSLTFSHDGKRLASTGCEHVIRIWDTATGDPLLTLTGNKHNVRTFTFAADGKTGISGGCDHSIRLWDLTTGKEKGQFVGHQGDVFMVKLDPAGTMLASGSHDGSVRLWDVKSATELRRCGGHANGVICVDFAPDGRSLATGGYDKVLRIGETATGQVRLAIDAEPVIREVPPLLSEVQLDKVAWVHLADNDGARVHRAIWSFVAAERGIDLLRERLLAKGPAAVDKDQVAKLIENLNHADFKIREKSMADLAKLGRGAVPLLRTTLAAKPDPETRRRIEQVLERFQEAGADADLLRQHRAVEILEQIGTRDAKRLIESLLAAAANPELHRHASAANARLTRRLDSAK